MARHGENIHKRKDGRWEARYIKYRTPEGKACLGYAYGHTYQEAKAKQLQSRNAATQCQLCAENPTFQEISIQWLESVRCGLKKSTAAHYRYTLERYIFPVMGAARVKQLDEMQLERMIGLVIDGNGMHRSLGISMAKECAALVKRICLFGSRHRVMRSVSLCVTLPAAKCADERPLSREERRKILNYVLAAPKPRNIGLLFSLLMGLRVGEVCGLKWEDIDLKGKTLTVRRTVSRICRSHGKTEVIVQDPKTKQSLRELPIPNMLVPVLKQLRRETLPSAWFLSGKTEKPVEPRCYQKSFKGCLKKCGVRDVRYHMLRHTFATTCLQSGCDIKTLSEIMGHSSPNVTLQRYVHTNSERKRTEINRFLTQETQGRIG